MGEQQSAGGQIPVPVTKPRLAKKKAERHRASALELHRMMGTARPHCRTTTAGPRRETEATESAEPTRPDLFYETLDALLTYVNRILGLSKLDRITMRCRDRRVLEEGSRVLDALWVHRELIGTFVRENPLCLPADRLACALPWCHAVRDLFACVDVHAEYAVYLGRDRLFAVRPVLGRPATPSATPSLARLALLPFDGHIVTDSRIVQLSDKLGPGGAEQLATHLTAASRQPLIETASQLIAFGKEVENP